MDSSPGERRASAAVDHFDDLDWDVSETAMDTAWSRTQSARAEGRTFGTRAGRPGSSRTLLQKSHSMPAESMSGFIIDSSPEMYRPSCRSVISEDTSSGPFVPPEEVPAVPQRHRRYHRSMSMFGSTTDRPTNLSLSMDFTRCTSSTSSITLRDGSVSSSNDDSMYGLWQDKSNADLSEPPPRPRRRRQARSMSMLGSTTRPTNQTLSLDFDLCPLREPSNNYDDRANTVFAEWGEQSTASLPANLPPPPSRIRHPRSSSMIGSMSHIPAFNTDNIFGDWEENSNPNHAALDDVERQPAEQRNPKKIRSRRHSIQSSVEPLSDTKQPPGFSNVGVDPLTWLPQASPEMKKFSSLCTDLSEVPTYPSPERSDSSSRKRGVCGSPLRDADEWYNSSSLSILSNNSAHRKSRIFAFEETESLPIVPNLMPEPQRSEMDIDSDDDDSNCSPNVSFTSLTSQTEKLMHNSLVDEAKIASPEYIFETMSSYEDLKFLIKALRKEENSRILSFGLSNSWNVAPPAAWSSSRRSTFLYWTSQHLGFAVRAVGAAVTYLQIPQSRGATVRKNLEAALIHYKHNEGRQKVTPIDEPFVLGSCTKPKQRVEESSSRYALTIVTLLAFVCIIR
jgi:hypothetical protein